MFPVGDEGLPPTRSFPIVNIGLIVLNFLAFFYELSLGGGLENFLTGYGTVPYELTHGVDLVGRVAGSPILQYPGPTPIYLTLLTSMFLHGGWLHIGGNMLYLFIFGDNVEDAMGSLVYLGFYLLSGLAASVANIIVAGITNDVFIPGVGASGAIAGVLGAYLVMFPRAQVRVLLTLGFFGYFTRVAAIFVLGFWFLLQFFNGVTAITARSSESGGGGGVAFWAHIGGFVFGALVAFLFYRGRQQPTFSKQPNA